MNIKKPTRPRLLLLSLLAALFLVLQSCYSVRLVNTRGVPEPDPLNNSSGFYRGKKVIEIDTTISLKLLQSEFTLLEKCNEGGFHSLEYRVTFGGVLLSGITFGKKRIVKIKYVCLKESN
ncbi:hypothetical protein [Daejeonella oryzae]|uniref:hypothetical protein n=1 Tax=Daejeonella oryzae TaxID=1122943 RepID=UPI00047ADE28|nr:hypothetical protein [Daejeonella oryzae]